MSVLKNQMPYPSKHRSARDAGHWRTRPDKALPFALADADAIRELYETHPQPDNVMDALCEAGHSTLYIPRTVMNEILRYDHTAADGTLTQGAYDFYLNNEKLDFYTGQDGLPDDARRSFSAYLQTHRDAGTLRCYPSMQAMQQQGNELTKPRGGIVVVDTSSPQKTEPPSRKGVKFLRTILPGTDPDNIIHFSSTKRNAGDQTLATLAAYLCERASIMHKKGSLLLVSNDIGCKDEVAKRCRPVCEKGVMPPAQINLAQLAHTLEYTGLMSPESNQQMVQNMVQHRYQNLIKRNDSPETLIEKSARASYTPNTPKFMNQCLDWLEATGIVARHHASRR